MKGELFGHLESLIKRLFKTNECFSHRFAQSVSKMTESQNPRQNRICLRLIEEFSKTCWCLLRDLVDTLLGLIRSLFFSHKHLEYIQNWNLLVEKLDSFCVKYTNVFFFLISSGRMTTNLSIRQPVKVQRGISQIWHFLTF